MAIIDRVSSLDKGYKSGDLSVYPIGQDSYETLYQAANNAETFLAQSLNYAGRFLIVDNTNYFPDSGLLRVGTEIIYYQNKTKTVFKNIIRGFVGSKQRPWPIGTTVLGSVMAEHHNAVKDATLNIETNLGTALAPDQSSLNGILTNLEYEFLSPKPLFRAAPIKGASPFMVRFQNFSDAPAIRYLWDFGDGSTSIETNPTHVYLASGLYTVKLSVITSLGASGITTKNNYILVDDEENLPFFYVSQLIGDTSTIFEFVDQSKGNITSRYWIWDDGSNDTVSDPDIHSINHQYLIAGQYEPTLLLVYADNTLKKIGLGDVITVTD